MARMLSLLLLLTALPLAAHSPTHATEQGFGVCNPVSQRKQVDEIGCWIVADASLGKLTEPQLFWHVDRYASRDAAEKAKTAHGTVIEAYGKVWLLTLERSGWRAANSSEHAAEIGPLAVHPEEAYSALFMETYFNPGMHSGIHTHSGPEAWYTLTGETCLETPQGKVLGVPGGKPAIVPEGAKMYLTATGKQQRRALTLILHPTNEKPTTIISDWQPKGLCK